MNTLTYPTYLPCIVCDTPTVYRLRHTCLEPCAHVVEFLEQLRRILEPHRRVCKDFHVAFDRRIGRNAHILHREEAARPVKLDVLKIVSIRANDCDFAVFGDAFQE